MGTPTLERLETPEEIPEEILGETAEKENASPRVGGAV
jgi:hypothetical protein